MGKLLRVLVVFLLLFSIGTLVLGIMLFQKRELLKGRTQTLEKMVEALGTTIESEPSEERVATYTAKDVSECTSEPLDNPERSDFWDNYKLHLEEQDLPKLDLAAAKIRKQLKQYYRIDPLTLRPLKDEYGRNITTGPGTMDEVLQDVLTKSAEQYARLNETRQQLRDLREELIRTISELNERKGTLRQRLGEIVTLKDRISSLEAQVRQLSAEVADLQTEKRRLEGQVADLQDDITGLKETIEKNDTYIKELEKENKELREGEGVDVADRDVAVAAKYMSPGDKGTVVSVNETWNFAVLNLGDDVLKELVADDGNLVLPFEFFLKRPSKDGTVVGKIRLIQVNMDEKLGIADILEDWLQVDVKSGDVVFH